MTKQQQLCDNFPFGCLPHAANREERALAARAIDQLAKVKDLIIVCMEALERGNRTDLNSTVINVLHFQIMDQLTSICEELEDL